MVQSLVAITIGVGAVSYIYDALGERIEKITSNPTLYFYDESSHLLGEYSSNGALTGSAPQN